jgi:hypothetical protein
MSVICAKDAIENSPAHRPARIALLNKCMTHSFVKHAFAFVVKTRSKKFLSYFLQ